MSKDGTRRRSPLDVFRYMDYRRFLADLYAAQKERGLSYRSFAKRAGLGAPNYLKLVIEGQRNLTPAMAERFATACGLSDEAARFFCELVTFCQAASPSEKSAAHQRLLAYRRYREAHRLDAAQADYHASWYLPAIRELVASGDFRDDPRWIARKLRPAYSAALNVCLPRVYGGVGGNGNRYATRAECEASCLSPMVGECPPNRIFSQQVCISPGLAGGCSETAATCALACSADSQCQDDAIGPTCNRVGGFCDATGW